MLDRIQKIGSLTLDRVNRVLVDGIVETRLRPSEFKLLSYLLLAMGDACTREEILTKGFGYSTGLESRMIDQCVYRVRKKLGREAGRLLTIPDVGYRLK